MKQVKQRQKIYFLGRVLCFLIMVWGSVSPILADDNQTVLYETDGMNRYSKVDGQSITRDGRGNVTDDGIATYSYNLLNQQTTATVAGQTTQYLYDALGRRIGKIQNGVTTRYIHDLSQQVLEEHQNGTLHARFTYGEGIDELLTMERSGQTYHYHQDALGNVTELTNDSGVVVERYKYNVYGKATITDGNNTPLISSSVGNEMQFNGRRYNPETNTYHYRARVYNPEWGQFLQRDTIDPGLLGVGPQGHNRYSYVTNNPINYTDPTGHTPKGKGSGGASGFHKTASKWFGRVACVMGLCTSLGLGGPIPDMVDDFKNLNTDPKPEKAEDYRKGKRQDGETTHSGKKKSRGEGGPDPKPKGPEPKGPKPKGPKGKGPWGDGPNGRGAIKPKGNWGPKPKGSPRMPRGIRMPGRVLRSVGGLLGPLGIIGDIQDAFDLLRDMQDPCSELNDGKMPERHPLMLPFGIVIEDAMPNPYYIPPAPVYET